MFLVWFLALVIIGGFVFWFGCYLLSSFFIISFTFFKNFNTFNFYFNNFILFIYLFIYLFIIIIIFLPFLLSHVADRVFVLWPGVRPMLLRWESRAQDIGPPETSQLHIISKSKSSPRDLSC